MELKDEQLNNVVAGNEFSKEIAIENQGLYRKEAIERLKNQKEELLKQDELSLEELDKITAGEPQFGNSRH